MKIAISRQLGDKCQSKTVFQAILDLGVSIVFTFSITAYHVCYLCSEILVGMRCQSEWALLRHVALFVFDEAMFNSLPTSDS